MAYSPPDVPSSYAEHDLGRVLYALVRDTRPRRIVEFGVLHGYSTIAMAQALRDNKYGHLTGYDLWDDYPYTHTTRQEAQDNIDRWGLTRYVTLRKRDFWTTPVIMADFIHCDISNDGKTIDRLWQLTRIPRKFDATVVFEGGTIERDRVEWMRKYGKVPIHHCGHRYEIIEPKFPSLSRFP